MHRTTPVLLTAALFAAAASAQPPAGLVQNPRFRTATADRTAPAHYTLTGNVAWAYCGWGDEASDWGVALHSKEPNPPTPFPFREGGERGFSPPSLLGKG